MDVSREAFIQLERYFSPEQAKICNTAISIIESVDLLRKRGLNPTCQIRSIEMIAQRTLEGIFRQSYNRILTDTGKMSLFF